METLSGMSVFVQVAEARSLSIAARQLGVTPSAVSKTLAKLEARVGVQLLHRTTRQVNLTEDGRVFFERCKRILTDVRDAELVLSQSNDVPSGRVHVAGEVTVLRRLVGPALEGFFARYPGITLELSTDDEPLDSSRDGVDVTLSWGRHARTDVIQRKVGVFRSRLYMSPALAKEHGAPKTFDALGRLDCLLSARQQTLGGWRLLRDRHEVTVPMQSRVSVGTDETLCDLACEGLGVIQVPEFVAAEQVTKGKLISVLDELSPEPQGLFCLYPAPLHHAPRVRAFVDWLIELLAAKRVAAA